MNSPHLDIQNPVEAIYALMLDVKFSRLDEASEKIIAYVLQHGGLEIQCVDKVLLVDGGGESILEYQFPGCEWKFRSLLARMCEISREAPRDSFVGNTNGFTADVALVKETDQIFRIQTKNVPEEQLYLLLQRIDYDNSEAQIPDIEGNEEISDKTETAYVTSDSGGTSSGS